MGKNIFMKKNPLTLESSNKTYDTFARVGVNSDDSGLTSVIVLGESLYKHN